MKHVIKLKTILEAPLNKLRFSVFGMILELLCPSSQEFNPCLPILCKYIKFKHR